MVYCRHCGTEATEDATFCRRCGAGLHPKGRGPVEEEVGRGASPRAWWYWLGILAILVSFFLLLDLFLGANNALFLLGTLSAAFLIGAGYFLLFASRRRYREPIVLIVGGILVMASIGALPFVALPLTRSWSLVDIQETYSVPFDADVRVLELTVQNSVGRVTITSVESSDVLAFVWVHVRGWGNEESAVAGISWSTDLSLPQASASLVMSPPAGGLLGSLSYAVDIHVSKTTILFLTLSSSTGSVTANFGSDTGLGAIELRTNAGSVSLNLDEVFLLPQTQLVVQATTGNIGILVRTTMGAAVVVPMVAETTGGNIDVQLDLGPTIAVQGAALAGFGTISLDEGKYSGTPASFTTPNIDDALTVIALSLTTAAGNIDIG